MAKDEWLKAAMTNDGVVVELLMHLKQAKAAPVTPSNHAMIPMRWGIRQPRSRPVRCEVVSARKEADSAKSARCSPTTPLSWSGGGGSASPSAAGDGCEETSRQTSGSAAAGSRSKVLALDETTNVSSTKRLRRKKTFAELKEEESALLNERICLKKEIATMRTAYKERSLTNENLKRMKIDLDLNCSKNLHSASEDYDKEISARNHERLSSYSDQGPTISYKRVSVCDHARRSHPCNGNSADTPWNSSFLLPDLNMVPSDDDLPPEIWYGAS